MNKICRNVLVTGGAGFIGLHLVPQSTTMITIITIVNTNVISAAVTDSVAAQKLDQAETLASSKKHS